MNLLSITGAIDMSNDTFRHQVDVPMKCVWITWLAVLTMVLVGATSCGNFARAPTVEIGDSSGSDSALTFGPRPLKSGPFPAGGSRFPDCNHYYDTSGKSDQPVEHVNCEYRDLYHLGKFYASRARVIVVGDISTSLNEYQKGGKPGEKVLCSILSGESELSVSKTLNFVPVDFTVSEIWKGSLDEALGAAFFGACQESEPYLCSFFASGSKWYVSPGPSLLLLNLDCCTGQFRPGYLTVSNVYPIENSMIYDWDGTAIPLGDVKKLMSNSEEDSSDPPSSEFAQGDFPCPTITAVSEGISLDVLEDTGADFAKE